MEVERFEASTLGITGKFEQMESQTYNIRGLVFASYLDTVWFQICPGDGVDILEVDNRRCRL